MEFLLEYIPPNEILTEEVEDGSFLIKGPFISYQMTKNNRRYPREIALPEIQRYMKESILTNRAFGELEHPNTVSINPDRVSHRVIDLKDVGQFAVGKAKVLDTPCGKIARTLIREGGMGVSIRSVGNVNNKTRDVEKFRLVAPDLVMNPSGLECFVEMMNESYEFYLNDSEGILHQVEKIKLKKTISAKDFRKEIIDAFKIGFAGLIKNKS